MAKFVVIGNTTVKEALTMAADLLSGAGRWTQRVFARNGDGTMCYVLCRTAACWCGLGAIRRVTGDDRTLTLKCCNVLERVLGLTSSIDFASWNDAPERKREEVIAALRRAAELA